MNGGAYIRGAYKQNKKSVSERRDKTYLRKKMHTITFRVTFSNIFIVPASQ